MASQTVKKVTQHVKPILSLNKTESRQRALNLYKAWYRQIPYIINQYDIPISSEQCKKKLREEFMKHKDLKDVRVIDMLIIKGQMDLVETVNIWKQKGHMMAFFKDTVEPKPKDFLSKFLAGIN